MISMSQTRDIMSLAMLILKTVAIIIIKAAISFILAIQA